jgi:hypothetical protein
MDWVRLLDDYNIYYVTRGPNTRRGEISITCPWCGEEDPSEHLGISLTAEVWGCHRDMAHRGKSPLRLISALLGCSNAQARLVVHQYDAADPETLDQALAMLIGVETKPMQEPEKLVMPDEFKAMGKYPSAKRFHNYLRSRGYSDPRKLSRKYNLRYCVTGRYKDRVIIPIYSAEGELLAWTGRAIQEPRNAPRYLSSDGIIKTCLFNEKKLLQGGQTLFVTEGPFDAMKLDYFLSGVSDYVVSTCTFGTSITIAQLGKLRVYSNNFTTVRILLDRDATTQAFAIADLIPKARVRQLPAGVKDPADLTSMQIHNIWAWA